MGEKPARGAVVRLSGRPAFLRPSGRPQGIPSFGSLLAFGRQGTYLGRALSASLAFCMFCVTTRVQGSGACRAPRCKDGFGFVVCREQLGLHMMIPTAGLRPRDMCRCASIKHSLKQESCWPCEYADGRQSARGRASRGEGWPATRGDALTQAMPPAILSGAA